MVVVQPSVQLQSKSLYQIKTVDVNFENLIMIQLWLECLRRSPGVDSQSVDIGHGDGMTSGVALEQVTLLD
jgi:hypothetical protein